MRIFGLDIGTTSVGFAVVDLNETRDNGKILRLGVRIFPEARDPDGTPLNQQRRAKRMMRRQLRRRRERRRSLNELLASSGLLPTYGSEGWIEMFESKKQKDFDPYALRDRGLDAPLSPYELGRALYHLAKRRHFKERDLAEAEEIKPKSEEDEEGTTGKRKSKAKKDDDADKDEAQSTAAREATVAVLKRSGETLGRHLAKIAPTGRKRGVHATRAIVLDEFARLCDAQAATHPVLNDPQVRGALEEAIFAQRPVFWRKSTLGSCRFIPGAPLCPKGSWLSQQRRMIEKVNNLAIAGGNARPLDPEERDAILAPLASQKSMTWPGVRNVLDPLFKARGESAKYVKFNLEYGDEKGGLKGNIVEADLAKIFGAKWASHPRKEDLRRIVPERLWQADYGEIGTQRVVIRPEKERASRRKNLADQLITDFGTSQTEADALVKLTFPQGWEPYSIKALEIFLPELEKGEKFGSLLNSPDRAKWRDARFPNRERPTGEILDKLPSPKDRDESRRIAQLRNPTVVRVQNEMRKVVNNLIEVYDKPDMIRIELTRDIGKSKREREEMTAGMRKRERERDKARKDLLENNLDPEKDQNIEKWLLWHECKKECPYTGSTIDFDGLFVSNHFQVEHIWPKSKSFDGSFRNKTLCREDVNKEKGNRTPFEYFQTKPPQEWEEVKQRVDRLVKAKLWSNGKAKRFLSEVQLDSDFTSGQLSDTGYAARQARAFLQRLQVDVEAVSGRVTAQLRRLWGLNHVLSDTGEKTRDDHRHHAIDALVVACAHGRYTQKLSTYFQKKKEGEKPHLPEPWPTIRKDAEAVKDEIVVSHRVRKKVSGPLHKETIYGDTDLDEKTKTGTYRLFVTRKPVERLSKSELVDIVDDHVREIVTDWVAAHGGDPKKAFATSYPSVSKGGSKIGKVRLRSKQQLSLMAPVSTGYADLGANHHIAIYRMPDGKIDFDVISLFEAARRLARREPVVRRDREDGSTFVMSLAPGDTLYFPNGKMEGYWVAQGAWASGQIVIVRANDAKNATITRPMAGSLIRDGARKVSVDPIGRVRPAND
jgi:CRISPR-associated endonuclease Csn1